MDDMDEEVVVDLTSEEPTAAVEEEQEALEAPVQATEVTPEPLPEPEPVVAPTAKLSSTPTVVVNNTNQVVKIGYHSKGQPKSVKLTAWAHAPLNDDLLQSPHLLDLLAKDVVRLY